MSNSRKMSTSTMVKIGILGAVSFLLMLVEFPLPLFPPFLKIDASDLPSIVATMSLGPVAGVMVQFIKNILRVILGSMTGGVGELANFLIGSLFVVPLGLAYKKLPNIKGYIVGAVIGTISMSVFAAFLNYAFLIPLYATLFGGMEVIVNMSIAVNPNLTDLRALVIFGIIPFNLIKCVAISILGYFTYRGLMRTPIFKKI